MFVRYLSVGDTERPMNPDTGLREGVTLDPTWEQIEQAIRGLEDDSLFLSPDPFYRGDDEELPDDDEPFMAISGDGQGVFCVDVNTAEGDFALTDLTKDPNAVREMFRGQTNIVSVQKCVDLNRTLAAAKEYVKSGKRLASLTWRE